MPVAPSQFPGYNLAILAFSLSYVANVILGRINITYSLLPSGVLLGHCLFLSKYFFFSKPSQYNYENTSLIVLNNIMHIGLYIPKSSKHVMHETP